MLIISKESRVAFEEGKVVQATIHDELGFRIVNISKTAKGYDIVKLKSNRVANSINFALSPVVEDKLNSSETKLALVTYCYNCGSKEFETLSKEQKALFEEAVKSGTIELHDNGEKGSKSACFYVWRGRQRSDMSNTGNKYLIAIYPKGTPSNNKTWLGFVPSKYDCVATLQGSVQQVEIESTLPLDTPVSMF